MNAAALEFDEPSHTYRLDGVELPSVTTVLEPFSGLEFARARYGAEYIARAAEFGQHVHIATDLYDREELDWDTLDPALVPYVNAWAKFLEDTGAVVIASELRVFSRTMRYAGTLDKYVAMSTGRRHYEAVVDVKSTTGEPRTVGAQTAAYVNALNEMRSTKVRTRYSLRLKPDAKYSLKPLTDPSDFARFQACLTLYRAGWIYSAKRA